MGTLFWDVAENPKMVSYYHHIKIQIFLFFILFIKKIKTIFLSFTNLHPKRLL